MRENHDAWENLVRQARQAPEPAPAAMPCGFASRVVANWPSPAVIELSAVWEFLSLRSLGLAALIMVVTLGFNYDLISHDWTQEVAVAETTFEPLMEP